MDRLDAMSTLLAVVEAGSFSGGGRRLGVPLATVSRKISDLERHLRTRLLTRSTRQLSLTEAGRSYVAAAKRILEDVGDAERTAAGEYSSPRGDLVITAPVVFGRLHVLPVVAEFLQAFQDINVRILLADRTANLLEDHIDVALRIGTLPDSNLLASRIGEIRRVTCASPGYLASHGEPQTPDALAGHDCVSFEGLNSAHAWIFATGNTDVPAPVRSRLIVNTAEAAIDAAVAGVGIARVLSYQIAQAVRSGALKLLLEGFEPDPWPVHLVHADQGIAPIKLRAFLDFAAPRLKARLSDSLGHLSTHQRSQRRPAI